MTGRGLGSAAQRMPNAGRASQSQADGQEKPLSLGITGERLGFVGMKGKTVRTLSIPRHILGLTNSAFVRLNGLARRRLHLLSPAR
jgi:hypothetical protein